MGVHLGIRGAPVQQRLTWGLPSLCIVRGDCEDCVEHVPLGIGEQLVA